MRKSNSRATMVAFSPDGSRLAAVGSFPGRTANVVVWDRVNGTEMSALAVRTKQVAGLAFSPDWERIATTSSDGTTKRSDAESGKDLLAISPGGGRHGCLAFSPDGKQLATGGHDGLVRP